MNAEKSSTTHDTFPWSHVVGFLLSIVLTLLAVWVMSQTGLPLRMRVIIIFVFAFIQLGVQLFMFMHIGEGKEGKWQIGHTVFALLIAVIVVIGTYFVLMTGHMNHGDMENMDHGDMDHGDMENMDHGDMDHGDMGDMDHDEDHSDGHSGGHGS